MNEIFPRSGVAVDPAGCAAEGQVAGERWLAINMVMSLDGAISVDGRSGGLAGPADRAMFLGLRAAAEVVLVGAETVRLSGTTGPGPAKRQSQSSQERRGSPRAHLCSTRPNRAPCRYC